MKASFDGFNSRIELNDDHLVIIKANEPIVIKYEDIRKIVLAPCTLFFNGFIQIVDNDSMKVSTRFNAYKDNHTLVFRNKKLNEEAVELKRKIDEQINFKP